MHLFQFCTFYSILVLLLQIKEHQALPSVLGIKLEEALAKPENAAMFNEINDNLESDYIDSVVNLSIFDSEKERTPAFMETSTTITSETPTTEISLIDADGKRRSSDGLLNRGLMSFFGSLMRLFHLDN